jgi:hypothetical protein
LWGKKFHVSLFPPLDDDGELEYLAAEEVKRLKLSKLDFGGGVLLIRPEYIKAYDSLDLVSPKVKHSVVVTGGSGIGTAFY